MRKDTFFRRLIFNTLFIVLIFSSPIRASITFRVFTGGPQAGEIHIDSPEGGYIYFRRDFRNDVMPPGFCGIRWSAFEEGELAWYWGNPGRLAMLPFNGAPTRELSYMARYSSCSEELEKNLFRTPSTPDGQAPPDAQMLVVEVKGWENVTFTGRRLQPLAPPGIKKGAGAGICQRYPGFCEYSPGLKHAYDDPCQHATYGNLICKLLPAAQASLIRTIDLARSMEGLQFEIQENMLLFYSSKGLKNLRQAIQQSQERLALAQHQFGQLHTAYCRLDTPLKQLSNLPFSHYIHATIFAHLDLSKVWLDQWQTHLIAIHASTEGKDGRPPQKHLKAMEECRLLALRHLEEAQFWMNRQYAWVLPMER